MIRVMLALLALTSAGVLIQAERTGNRPVVYASKPLTMLAVLLVALMPAPQVEDPYRLLIGAGLACSLAGDLFLMWPRDRFVAGLAAFFAAHVFYVAAFAGRAPFDGIAPFLPFLVAALFVSRLLWPATGRLRIPVTVYAVILAVMGGSALAAAMTVGSVGAWLAASGSLLFLLSDTALGMDRFVGQIQGGKTLILATYVPAQLLIALSVGIA